MTKQQTYGEWIKAAMEKKGLTPLVCCRRALSETGKEMQHSQWNALMEDEPRKANGDAPERSGKVAKRVALALGIGENESRLAAGLAPLPDLPNGEGLNGDAPAELPYERRDDEEILRFYHGISPPLQPKAKDILKAMSDALANTPRPPLAGLPRSCVFFDPDANVWYETDGQEITDAYRLRSLISRAMQRPTIEKVEELREKIAEAKASH